MDGMAARSETGDRRVWIAVFVSFAATALLVYWPALGAFFYSDDTHYLVYNEYVQDLSWSNLADIMNPTGAVAMMTQNYAPMHLLGHGFAYQLFGLEPLPHHLLNVFLHALGSTMLAGLFKAWGAPRPAAILGGALFLVHPVNVEAVAWISQLKTDLAFCFAVGALHLRRRSPGAATLLFALALLTKALAAFALPVAALFAWIEQAGRAGREPTVEARRAWWVIGGWAAVFVVYTVLEFPLFAITNANAPPLHPELWGNVRAIIAVAGRYLDMALTSRGLSAFHEAPAVEGWLDPLVIASISALSVLAVRMTQQLAARRVEGVFWAWATISFGPVCQVFPFLYPMGDRYLYFVLPGLIGGALFAGLDLLDRKGSPPMRRAAGLLAAVYVAGLGLHAHHRATIWSDPAQVDAEAVTNYPEGLLAAIIGAQRAARAGDADEAVRLLERSIARGNQHFWSLQSETLWDPVRDDPGFQRVIRTMARYWVEIEPRYTHASQIDLRGFAEAHEALGDLDAAEGRLERALEVGGLRDADVRQQLIKLRIKKRRLEREAREAPAS